ncbi:MAG: hypothetical protein QY326_03315 [Bdellovibrionota bacterium]|nr:MAG: hypothetical protein QY326_03315 [Bdellovibrionota bacterium]
MRITQPKLIRTFLWSAGVLCCLVVLFLATAYETAHLGPYTTWFNENLEKKSKQAALVGDSVARVVPVLGSPSNVRQFWEVIGADGKPAPGAHFVTTYEYFPYPWIPFSKFQVHTSEGIVRGIEKFDD